MVCEGWCRSFGFGLGWFEVHLNLINIGSSWGWFKIAQGWFWTRSIFIEGCKIDLRIHCVHIENHEDVYVARMCKNDAVHIHAEQFIYKCATLDSKTGKHAVPAPKAE